MDNKIIAIALVAIVIVAGAATFFVLNDDDKDDEFDSGAYNIIGRVNSEGSGLYIDSSLLVPGVDPPTRASNNTPFFNNDYKITEDNKAAWGGLILGDPGASSIQHTQLAEIAAMAGLDFKQYTDTTTVNNNTLYYVTNLSNKGVIEGNTDIQGGIIWEPQHQRVIQEISKYVELALTNDLFKDHTCCIVAANHDWLQSNSAAATKFLAGYIEGVKFVISAINNKDADYDWLVDFAKSKTSGLDETEVEDALANITYLYADNAAGSLSKLTNDISELAVNLKNLGLISNDKFSDGNKFAELIVDDTYMKEAATGNASTDGKDSVRVAAINGDIHQIAIHVAKEKGYFDKYGLTVNINNSPQNGGDVVTLLLSKDTDIGFLGAPPATLNAINGNHISL